MCPPRAFSFVELFCLVMRQFAQHKPLVLFFDDVQWASPESLKVPTPNTHMHTLCGDDLCGGIRVLPRPVAVAAMLLCYVSY